MDDQFKASLASIEDARIFFGHQSVGGNILRELQASLAAAGSSMHVRELRPDDSAVPGLMHASVGTNYHPETKCSGFAESIEKAGGKFDIAVLKFCYVDFSKDTDPAALIETYARTVRGLKSKYPRILFVHATAPLKASEGLKSAIKKLLGKGNPEVENARRNEYNLLLTERFKGEPIFDLAKVESTRPDGSRETFMLQGKTYYRMASEYTDDGGHLNKLGGQRAAKEFVKVLSAAVRSVTASGSVNAALVGR